MDNNASALFREGLETEKRMGMKWMMEMDLSDAKEIPTEVLIVIDYYNENTN